MILLLIEPCLSQLFMVPVIPVRKAIMILVCLVWDVVAVDDIAYPLQVFGNCLYFLTYHWAFANFRQKPKQISVVFLSCIGSVLGWGACPSSLLLPRAVTALH